MTERYHCHCGERFNKLDDGHCPKCGCPDYARADPAEFGFDDLLIEDRVITVALIGCGKKKGLKRARARDLYTGPLFRATLEHAEATADQVFILSARYGLVETDREIDPYDLPISKLTDLERERWGADVARRLQAEMFPKSYLIQIYAGQDYVRAVYVGLVDTYNNDPPEFVDVLRGLTQGRRLAWLKSRREERARK